MALAPALVDDTIITDQLRPVRHLLSSGALTDAQITLALRNACGLTTEASHVALRDRTALRA